MRGESDIRLAMFDVGGTAIKYAVMWLMWQHLLEQIYERIRPASLNSTGLM